MNLEIIGLMLFAMLLIIIISLGNIFEECKKKGYLVVIPFVNLMVLLRITLLPKWWVFPLLIPIVNLYFFYRIFVNLSIGFGKDKTFGIKILLLPFIYLPLLAYYSKYDERFQRKLIINHQGYRH